MIRPSLLGPDRVSVDERVAVAAHRDAPAQYLARFASDRSPEVRAAVAGNPSALERSLVFLARDPDWAVRAAVGANRGTPPGTLATLARDRDEAVRVPVAGNPGTPQSALLALARDTREGVRMRALASLPVQAAARMFLDDEGGRSRVDLAATGRCDAGGDITQVLLGVSGEPGVAGRVALARVCTDADLLRELATGPDGRVADAARWRLLELA